MPNGAYLVVGRYSGVSGTVLGNMTGRYADNVLPLRGPNYKPKVSERDSHACIDMHENSFVKNSMVSSVIRV